MKGQKVRVRRLRVTRSEGLASEWSQKVSANQGSLTNVGSGVSRWKLLDESSRVATRRVTTYEWLARIVCKSRVTRPNVG